MTKEIPNGSLSGGYRHIETVTIASIGKVQLLESRHDRLFVARRRDMEEGKSEVSPNEALIRFLMRNRPETGRFDTPPQIAWVEQLRFDAPRV